MHMADALLSPEVGGTMWAATAAVTICSARKVQGRLDSKTVPLMGVLGAFVFAAQMINFAIPGTGSSGHLGGGLLLAILLGPQAAFLTMASVLTVQALFFADGGLLALGCNIFNLGFFPCFIAYPLIYKTVAGDNPGSKRLAGGSILASVIGLQLGSFGVVLQTYLSDITALPFFSFLLLMQAIHLAIGLMEGLATAGIVSFIRNARPEILAVAAGKKFSAGLRLKNVLVGLLLAFVLTGGILTWFASENPDGLEWALDKVAETGNRKPVPPNSVTKLEDIQAKTSFLPNYAFKTNETSPQDERTTLYTQTGTSISGLLGGTLVMACGVLIGFLLKKKKQAV